MAAQESSPCDSAATAAWAQLLQDEAQLTAEVGRKGGMLDSCEATLTWDGAYLPGGGGGVTARRVSQPELLRVDAPPEAHAGAPR